MSEFKNIPNDEKITHYLADELSTEEKTEFEIELKKDAKLAAEFKISQSLISLMNVDKNSLTVVGGIGAERKNNIFGKHHSPVEVKKESRVINVVKHLRFTLVAAAIVLFSYAFFPELWKTSQTTTIPKVVHEPEVFGVRSFNIALPSGTYLITSKDGYLNIDNIKSTEGNDYFKTAGVQAGDQILKINGIDAGSIKSDELSSLLTSLLENPSVYLQVRRNGQILPANNVKP